MLFAIQEAKKLPENDNLRKIHNQFEQHNSGEQHTGRQLSLIHISEPTRR